MAVGFQNGGGRGADVWPLSSQIEVRSFIGRILLFLFIRVNREDDGFNEVYCKVLFLFYSNLSVCFIQTLSNNCVEFFQVVTEHKFYLSSTENKTMKQL